MSILLETTRIKSNDMVNKDAKNYEKGNDHSRGHMSKGLMMQKN
jgi:hypothetical protein